MIIVHLITSIDKGGAETHLYSLIKKQVANKNKVYVVFLKGNGYWKKFLTQIGVKVFKLNFENNYNLLNFIKVFLNLKKLIIKISPNIVHAHLSTMEILGALVKFSLKKKFKFFITKHLDSFFLEASFGRKIFLRGIFIDRFIINQCSKVICISKQVRKYFQKKIKKKNKYKLIYYGFSSRDFKSNKNLKSIFKKIRVKYKIHKKDFIITNIARHVRQKSLDVLLKAYSIYIKKSGDSKLILVGNGIENSNLKKLANKLEINHSICWINNYEKIKDIFLLSDVFILPSKYEGLGLVLLEAMSSKTPIIASNSSAIPELIKNNYNGFLFKEGDYEDLAKKMKYIENKNLRKKFSRNSVKFLNNNFDIDKMNTLTSIVYTS